MQIVIDIPEELKNKIDNANEDNYRTYIWWFETTLYCAIKNSIPLPKGHGRIIDESQVTGTFIWDNGYIECYAPTIIEADKAESEDKICHIVYEQS